MGNGEEETVVEREGCVAKTKSVGYTQRTKDGLAAQFSNPHTHSSLYKYDKTFSLFFSIFCSPLKFEEQKVRNVDTETETDFLQNC